MIRTSCRFLLAACCILLTHPGFAGAGEGHNVLGEKVAKAQRSGTRFPEVSLFAAASGAKHATALEAETLLQPLATEIAQLFATKPQAVSLNLRTESGATYQLQMLQSQPVSDAVTAGTIDLGGRHEASYTPGLHYQGSVAGADNSMAAVSIFANGDVMILFSTDEGNFIVGRLEDGSGNYVFYNDKDMRYHPEMPCGVKDGKVDAGAEPTGNKTTSVLMCNKVKIYWEVANNFYVSKASSLTNTQNYVTGLFNQMQALYTNDNIAVELKSVYIWTTADGFPVSGSSPGLDMFKGYWNKMGNSFDGDLAHYVCKTNNGNGGLAYLTALCNRNIAYAYSDITGTYQNVPTYSWDAMVVSHETGHNMGSMHTHWCGWNTGVNNSCGSIDNCTTQQSGSSCNTCPSTYLNSAPASAWKGTIMSYCHLVSRGISLANGFGPLPGAHIRAQVTTGTCLAPVINAKLAAAPLCSGTGSVTLTYPANNRGTAPYNYYWSTGATTQDLNNITVANSYSVQIEDSNHCVAEFFADVKSGPFGGDAAAFTGIMPLCCQATNLQIPLKASPALFNSSCQNVYWLRSEIPLTSMTELRSYFDTTQPSNIMVSANNGNISATTGATLNVSAPAVCAGPVSYYYTPLVVSLPRIADSITYTTTGPLTSITNFSVPIGASVTLPDQRALITACQALDTPTSQSLIVTISGYTGRANLLRLIIEDDNNHVLYQRFGLAGNGAYAIPATAFNDSILRSLVISAVDYNCSTNPNACVASQVMISAERKVLFAQLPVRPASSCAVGTAARLDFAPAGCTPLSAVSAAFGHESSTLSPNPAAQSATLKFHTAQAGGVQIRVTNLAGQVIEAIDETLSAGAHAQVLNVRSWAKGMYFVTLSTGKGKNESLKLVVE